MTRRREDGETWRLGDGVTGGWGDGETWRQGDGEIRRPDAEVLPAGLRYRFGRILPLRPERTLRGVEGGDEGLRVRVNSGEGDSRPRATAKGGNPITRLDWPLGTLGMLRKSCLLACALAPAVRPPPGKYLQLVKCLDFSIT